MIDYSESKKQSSTLLATPTNYWHPDKVPLHRMLTFSIEVYHSKLISRHHPHQQPMLKLAVYVLIGKTH